MSLIKFVARCFILLDAIISGIFLIFVSDCYSCIETQVICILIGIVNDSILYDCKLIWNDSALLNVV